jgi:hypothetical protein
MVTESDASTLSTALTLTSSTNHYPISPSTPCGLHPPTSPASSETPPLGTSIGTAPAGTGTGKPATLNNGTFPWSAPSLHSQSYYPLNSFSSEAASAPRGGLFWTELILLITLAYSM